NQIEVPVKHARIAPESRKDNPSRDAQLSRQSLQLRSQVTVSYNDEIRLYCRVFADAGSRAEQEPVVLDFAQTARCADENCLIAKRKLGTQTQCAMGMLVKVHSERNDAQLSGPSNPKIVADFAPLLLADGDDSVR